MVIPYTFVHKADNKKGAAHRCPFFIISLIPLSDESKCR